MWLKLVHSAGVGGLHSPYKRDALNTTLLLAVQQWLSHLTHRFSFRVAFGALSLISVINLLLRSLQQGCRNHAVSAKYPFLNIQVLSLLHVGCCTVELLVGEHPTARRCTFW